MTHDELTMTHTELTDEEYAKFCGLIYRTAGIRIADNKRVMVGNRVRRRLRATGIAGFAEYYAFLTSPAGAGEMPPFLDAITTNETYFFRDIQHYQWLGGRVPPRDRPPGRAAQAAPAAADLVGGVQHRRGALLDGHRDRSRSGRSSPAGTSRSSAPT